MSKNTAEIRAFTRQMAEEGRVEYSIDQWYDAEKRLQRTYTHYATSSGLQPEGWNSLDDSERMFSVVDKSDGQFFMTMQQWLVAQANRTISNSNTYDQKLARYIYNDRHNGWENALRAVGEIQHFVKIAIACRQAYPFVNWLTKSTKPNSRGNKRYAAAKEKWNNNKWSGVAYYKRKQQIAVGDLHGSESWLNDKHWNMLESQSNTQNIARWEANMERYQNSMDKRQEKIDKVKSQFGDSNWVATFLAKELSERIRWDLDSVKQYEKQITDGKEQIANAKEAGLIESDTVITEIVGDKKSVSWELELRDLINPKKVA